MEDRSEGMICRIVGRLGRAPEGRTSLGGVEVCRLIVVNEAAGPVSSPPRVGLYLTGELARRCRKGLGEGDLIRVLGNLGTRRPGSKVPDYPEVVVDDDPENVKLWERAGVAA
jgi:hypothetical protein